MSYTYMGAPYSHDRFEIMEGRFRICEFMTAVYSKEGKFILCPIVHFHECAKNYQLPTNAGHWQGCNFSMLRHAHSMFTLELPGWQHSRGLADEGAFADHAGILNVPISWDNIKHIINVKAPEMQRHDTDMMLMLTCRMLDEAAL